MASSSEPRAASKVFAIPELLEMILLETDEITIFALQSVSKTFHGMINGSIAIRSRMCRLPTTDYCHLADVLARDRVTFGTFPHRVVVNTSETSPDIEIELPCKWLQEHNRDDKAGLYAKLTKSTGSGSWRQIKIGDPHQNYRSFFTCEKTPFSYHGMVVEAKHTLGDLVDWANTMIKKHLEAGVVCNMGCTGRFCHDHAQLAEDVRAEWAAQAEELHGIKEMVGGSHSEAEKDDGHKSAQKET